MTAQFPEELENDHPRVDFGGLRLYGVIRGPVHLNHGRGNPYGHTAKPKKPRRRPMCTANWKGYTEEYRLTEEGRLVLKRYSYRHNIIGRWWPKRVNETLHGDFFMVMKPKFFGLRTYVPFRDGVIVEDMTEWVREDERTT